MCLCLHTWICLIWYFKYVERHTLMCPHLFFKGFICLFVFTSQTKFSLPLFIPVPSPTSLLPSSPVLSTPPPLLLFSYRQVSHGHQPVMDYQVAVILVTSFSIKAGWGMPIPLNTSCLCSWLHRQWYEEGRWKAILPKYMFWFLTKKKLIKYWKAILLFTFVSVTKNLTETSWDWFWIMAWEDVSSWW